MDTAEVELFLSSLDYKDDVLAISYLEGGIVSDRSVFHFVDAPEPWPIFFAVLQYDRESVIRDMVRRGTDMNQFFPTGDADNAGHMITPTACAIGCGSLSMLKVCHDKGARFHDVYRFSPGEDGQSLNAMQCAIMSMEPACLTFLLDSVYSERPTVLSRRTMELLAPLAQTGGENGALSV